ncbi:MAG: PfkB family carbohydrate kinase [Saccharospirillum sp.]
MKRPYDILALGESLLRLTPPHLERLEQISSLQVMVGGSESNTLSAMSRFGSSCAWLSRLPDTALGRMICNSLSRHGVDTRFVADGGHDRVGLYFYEPGKPPHRSHVIYDRKDSAMANITPNDLPTELFHSDKVRLFHTTGITLGLSSSARETVGQALALSKAGGVLTSLDVNYREKLWPSTKARATLEPLLTQLDVLLIAERDIHVLWPERVGATPAQTLGQLQALTNRATMVMTRGKQGAVALSPEGDCFSADAFYAEEVDRVGGGDAFSAGFLTAWLDGQPLSEALLWGTATAAFKYATPGDVVLVDRSNIESLISQGPQQGIHR